MIYLKNNANVYHLPSWTTKMAEIGKLIFFATSPSILKILLGYPPLPKITGFRKLPFY
jgi:hypothetical protein